MSSEIKNFKKEHYIGTWYKYGSALKWYQPMIDNLVLNCTGDMKFTMDFTLLKTKQKLNGKLQILGHPTSVKMSIDQKVLFMNPVKTLTIVDVIKSKHNKYIVLLTDDNILTVLCNSLNVPKEDNDAIMNVVRNFNFKEKDFKISKYD